MNNGFNNLQINNGATSPYGTGANPSHASIAASLQRERGISQANGVRNSGTASLHQQPLSPLAQQQQQQQQGHDARQAFQTRTAPSITNNPMKEVYNAGEPTAGQPYAFPDPDMEEADPIRPTMSRRNSAHESIASSVITTDSKYPHGQHRFDDGKVLTTRAASFR